MTKIYTSPDKYRFDQVYAGKDYAVNCLINGNPTQTIIYLKDLITSGHTGMNVAHDELIKIKEKVPEKYEYIKKQVFNPFYRPK